MTKKVAILSLIVLIITILVACELSDSETSEVDNTSTTAISTSVDNSENIYGRVYEIEGIPFEPTTQMDKKPFSKEDFKKIIDNLGVLFDTTAYSIDFINDESVLVESTVSGDNYIYRLFISNELLSSHKLKFYGSQIERFIPEILPDDEPIDGLGAIHESDLETGVAISWEENTQLLILIDSKYTVYINE